MNWYGLRYSTNCTSIMHNSLSRDIYYWIDNLYKPLGLEITTLPIVESESAEYGACRFSINNHNVVFRIAKTTPKKIGQFVTLWQRDYISGKIIPLDQSEDISYMIVSVIDSLHEGQFIFSKDLLVTKGIISNNFVSGKLAFRVYPPWVQCISQQAVKTQKWQSLNFISTDMIDYRNEIISKFN